MIRCSPPKSSVFVWGSLKCLDIAHPEFYPGCGEQVPWNLKVFIVVGNLLFSPGRKTHEMSDAWAPGDYNLVGFVVGAVEREMKLPQPETIVDGDLLIGIASSGPQSQAFSLVRKILLTSSLHYLSLVPGGCNTQTIGISIFAILVIQKGFFFRS